MRSKISYLIALSMITVIAGCNRSPKSVETAPAPRTETGPQQPGTAEGTGAGAGAGAGSTTIQEGVNPPSDDPNASIIKEDTIQIQESGLCFDVSGKEMVAQFQDATKNSPTNKTADCYSKSGALLYKGNASNCLEEMQARFGPDIIFPAQQVFPKQYEAARAQGANGQAALKSTLASGTCKALKAKE